ncbi:hypothetical protein IQ06DRAFT_335670 [Phaeosphaeriaceae sp. SRC1lsM3a]|nr:hypothetical protein IQ06DRAFT_335670 [Stagonospora sp. SRC1lsM3a]
MTLIHMILLLAAYQNVVSAGPLPRADRRQLLQSYANTTQTLPSLSQTGSTAYPSASPSKGQLVNADTAIVIEPVQRTVVTHVIPAVTFLNPKGEPIATQTAETVLSTSYFTPTPQPAPSPSTPTTSSTPSSSKPPVSSISISSSKPIQFTSSPALAAPMSSQAAVESGPVNQTSRPAFTYSPEEGQSAVSTISSTSISTIKSPAGNATGLPGFDHPGSAPTGVMPPKAPLSSAATNSTRTSKAGKQPSTALVTTGSTSNSPVVVTKTEYTTVFPSPTISTPLGGSELIAGSTPIQASQPVLSSSKASPALLLPTSLVPPPVVIITQYTTVAPAPTGGAPAASNTPTIPAPVPSAPSPPPVVPQPSSPVAEPSKPSPSSATPPASSSRGTQVPAQSSSPAAPPLPPKVSSSPTLVQPSPAQSTLSSIASSTTSEGPLIITPIAPSQIFTVTVTATEKETVTETATVSVTVTA